MKKLLLLGGSRYLIPIIECCHKLGVYTITCDYLPNNIAHTYSDEYHNISIIDKEKILELASNLDIDGIMSFACDPGVVTAAYVAERLNLPFQCSYEAAKILQNKGLFRKFLIDNKFNCPHAKSYEDINDALNDKNYFTWPVIVKPVDSAGSKGVTRVDDVKDLPDAIRIALSEAHNDSFIIEDFLTFKGYHSSADCFSVDGELLFCTFSDQLFDKKAENPYTPATIIWPATMEQSAQQYLTDEIQRLIELLNMKTGIYNIETCVGSDGKPYIMEVSPRGGGCKIAEIQKLATNTDLIEAEVKKAIGEKIENIDAPKYDSVWCEFVIHDSTDRTGKFNGLTIDSNIRNKYIKLIDLSTKKGDLVEPFTGANKALGDMFLRFDSREELEKIMQEQEKWLKIELENESAV